MLKKVKTSLRMTSDALNDDVSSTINAALLDMRRVGVDTSKVDITKEETYDDLTLNCVEFYCKWIFNFLGRGEEWRIAYEKLRDSMSRCGDYN